MTRATGFPGDPANSFSWEREDSVPGIVKVTEREKCCVNRDNGYGPI